MPTEVYATRAWWEKFLMPAIGVFISAMLVANVGKMAVLEVKLDALEKRIERSMGDRFTGADGKALDARVVVVEKEISEHEDRIDEVEKVCVSLRSRPQ